MWYLLSGEATHVWYPDIHTQRLLSTKEVVKLNTVVTLTVVRREQFGSGKVELVGKAEVERGERRGERRVERKVGIKIQNVNNTG